MSSNRIPKRTPSAPRHTPKSQQQTQPLKSPRKFNPRKLPTLKPKVITIGSFPKQQQTASTFRTYIHVSAPEFREEAARQMRSLLLASAPRLKIPKIMTKGSQGLLVDATLRDIYVLSHGLRCADDIMIQLGRPTHRVGSFNKFITNLAKLPLHAFAPRIMPKETPHRVGKQSKSRDEEDLLLEQLTEAPLLHNNIRILTNRSILSNQKTLKQFSVQTIRKLLTLRRGQSLKKRNVKYTDNPALFGKAEDEIEETLLQIAEDKAAKNRLRIELKQLKRLEENKKNHEHMRNLFSTHLRQDTNNNNSNNNNNDNNNNNSTTNFQGFSQMQNSSSSSSNSFLNSKLDEGDIPMSNTTSSRNNNRKTIVNRNNSNNNFNNNNNSFLSQFDRQNNSRPQSKASQKLSLSTTEEAALEAVLDDLDDEEIGNYVIDRTQHFRRLGLEYNPYHDPVVEDFLAAKDTNYDDDDFEDNNNNNSHKSFKNNNNKNIQHKNDHNNKNKRKGPWDVDSDVDDYDDDDDGGDDSADEPALDGTSVNYNDFVDANGKLDEEAFNKALSAMLASQGYTADDLEENSLQDVTKQVGDHVQRAHIEKENQVQKKQKLRQTGLDDIDENVDDDDINYDQDSDNNNDINNMNEENDIDLDEFADYENEMNDASENDDELTNLDNEDGNNNTNQKYPTKVLQKYSADDIENAMQFRERIVFLRNELYHAALLRGDTETLQRLEIEMEDELGLDEIEKQKSILIQEQLEMNKSSQQQQQPQDFEMNEYGQLVPKSTQQQKQPQFDQVELFNRLRGDSHSPFQARQGHHLQLALDLLDDRAKQIEDANWLLNFNQQLQSKTPINYIDNDDDDDLSDADNHHDLNKAFSTMKKQKLKSTPTKELSPQEIELQHSELLDQYKHRLASIQARANRQDSVDFYLNKFAEYENGTTTANNNNIDTNTVSPQLYKNASKSTKNNHDIQQIYKKYQEKFSNTVRLKEREPPSTTTTTSSSSSSSSLSTTTTTTPTTKDVTKSQLSPLDDPDQEYPSDYTEGEGVELHWGSKKPLTKTEKRIQRENEKKEKMLTELKETELISSMDYSSQLDNALQKLQQGLTKTNTNDDAKPKTHVVLPNGEQRPLLAPSLLAVAWSYVGKRGTNASKRILATAKTSAPSIYTFLPPQYRGLNIKRLHRRARHDPILKTHILQAKLKVQSMNKRFALKDAKVKRDLKNAAETSIDKLPALMIPFRPHSDIPNSCMTISLRRNTMRVSISAIGSKNQSLHKRGYRTHLIETSLRESIANGCLGIAYNVMTPIDPSSPLIPLETDNKYLQPIRSSLLYLARDVRIGFNPQELQQIEWTPEHQRRQDLFLTNAVAILGEERAQQQLLSSLIETRRDVLSNPTAFNEVINPSLDGQIKRRSKLTPKKVHQIDPTKPLQLNNNTSHKKGQHKPIAPLNTTMIDDVIENMSNEQFSHLVNELTAQNGGKLPIDTRTGQEIDIKPLLRQAVEAVMTSVGDNPNNVNMDQVLAQNPLLEASSLSSSLLSSSQTTSTTTSQPSQTQSTTTLTTTEKQNDQIVPQDKQLLSFDEIKVARKDVIKSFQLSTLDIMNAIGELPQHQRLSAITSLASGIPFDPIKPLPSPLITPIRTIALHNRDHTPLREVLSHTLSSGIIDADPAIRVYDPFCGSGTIVIESVLRFLGLPLQPLARPFAFENWPIHDEYQYNAMMWEWKGRYQHVVKDFVKTFGITKYQTLNGDFSSIDGLSPKDRDLEISFPLFVGTDLRYKSINAAVQNSHNAGMNYFTHFFQGDFQAVINEANRLWIAEQNIKNKQILEAKLKEEESTLGDDFFSQFGGSNNNNNNTHSSDLLSNSTSSIIGSRGKNRPKASLLSLEDAIDPMLGDDDIISFGNKKKSSQLVVSNVNTPLPSKFPLTKPYLKGYTMFSNIPWGVIDEKPSYYNRNDPDGSRYANITQQEPVEELYIRLGKTLHDNKDLFRDVFILSAHQKFEKLTSIGAQRAARENERKIMQQNLLEQSTKQQPGLVKVENGMDLYHNKKATSGILEWDKVASFYNNGVKTHLLKLKM